MDYVTRLAIKRKEIFDEFVLIFTEFVAPHFFTP
jgi:hypothetical protein